MKELRSPDHTLKKILPPQTLKAGMEYVRSVYALPYYMEAGEDISGCRTLWFNTLTRQLVEPDRAACLPKRVSAEEISSDPELTALMRGYFLVPEGRDEAAFYLQIYQIMHALAKKNGVKGFTILPATSCNARCVYCYEEGWRQETMTPETADQVVRYIDRVRCPGEIELQWFGGEPLTAVSVIDRICMGLRQRGISFSGGMVTNASLLSEEILQKMTSLWNVRTVQVSMDGDERDYTARKQYVQPGDHYHNVLRSVRLLAERHLRVHVRCNVDENNIDSFPLFLADLEKAVSDPGLRKYIKVYESLLDQARMTPSAPRLWEQIAASVDYIRGQGFQVRDSDFTLHDFRSCFCMADLGSVVIRPDGSLYACEYCTPSSCFGNILTGNTDESARKNFCRTDLVRSKCRDCPFLPECTPFASCPHTEPYCREIHSCRYRDSVRNYLKTGKGNLQ